MTRLRHLAILLLRASLLVAALASVGCGKTISRTASEQLLTSDAVDRSIQAIDFGYLAGEKVFLDTQYLNHVKAAGFVNADYIVSSLRQQVTAAGCLLQDSKEQADYVLEARCGALGNDANEIVYGVPSTDAVGQTAAIFANAPVPPVLPEISLAKVNRQMGAAKVAVFAYHRETRERVWQSGIVQSTSTARDTWVLGAGPFQRGTIYKQAKFAGKGFGLHNLITGSKPETPRVPYDDQVTFAKPFPEPVEEVPTAVVDGGNQKPGKGASAN